MNNREGRDIIPQSYNKLNPKYFDKGGGNEGYYGRIVQALLTKAFRDQNPQSYLEIGPGGGNFAHDICQKLGISRAQLVDCSAAALQLSSKKIRDINISLELTQADFSAYVVPSETDGEALPPILPADIVFQALVGEYLQPFNQHVAALVELTNPGGYTVIVDLISDNDPTKHEGRMSIPKAFQLLTTLLKTYIGVGVSVPVADLMSAAKNLSQIYTDPDFVALNEFHHSYFMPWQAWQELAQQYSDAQLFPAGPVAVLLIPKI